METGYILINHKGKKVKGFFTSEVSAKSYLTHAKNIQTTGKDIDEKWLYFSEKGWRVERVKISFTK